jgi:hypothetical protein
MDGYRCNVRRRGAIGCVGAVRGDDKNSNNGNNNDDGDNGQTRSVNPGQTKSFFGYSYSLCCDMKHHKSMSFGAKKGRNIFRPLESSCSGDDDDDNALTTATVKQDPLIGTSLCC